MFARIKKVFWKSKVQVCVASHLVAHGLTTKEARDGSTSICLAYDPMIEACFGYADPFTGDLYSAEDTAALIWDIFVADGMPIIEGEVA